MRVLRRYPLTSLFITSTLIVGPPLVAYSAEVQYALNRHVPNYQLVYSASATVTGGKMQFGSTAPNGMKLVIQTYAPTYGVVYAASGATFVSWTHEPVSNAQSRCYWYYSFGNISGTMPINCWRRS